MSRTISRREFVRIAGVAVAELLAAGCQARRLVTPEATWFVSQTEVAPSTLTASATASTTATPPPPPATVTLAARPSATATPAPATATTPPATATPAPTALPTATATPVPTTLPADVAIAQVGDYTAKSLRQHVRLMMDGLGGLGDVIRPGDKVAIKVNLTGGTFFEAPGGRLAIETYVTHPEVVRAVGECLRDAGAGSIWIVEAVFDNQSYPRWGYEQVARALGATLVDLNRPDPYAEFATVPVGGGWSVYDSFVLNRVVSEADCFVSVAKMKCHYDCGITLSMKNLIGLVPVSYYRQQPDHWWRSALHGNGEPSRLPGVILDLNRARPIHLAVIDGIKTAEGGEVPRGSFAPVSPGVLLAGKNAVSTDAAATAVMGFEPTTAYPKTPFLRGDNYLNAAAALGLGTNRLAEIGIAGTTVDKVRTPFAAATSQ